jgi:hypothetical protein
MNCPWSKCDKPLAEHDNFAKTVHRENAENESTGPRNGGVLCDATSGPCACGAWH